MSDDRKLRQILRDEFRGFGRQCVINVCNRMGFHRCDYCGVRMPDWRPVTDTPLRELPVCDECEVEILALFDKLYGPADE